MFGWVVCDFAASVAVLASLAVSGWSGMPGQPDNDTTYFIYTCTNRGESRVVWQAGQDKSIVIIEVFSVETHFSKRRSRDEEIMLDIIPRRSQSGADAPDRRRDPRFRGPRKRGDHTCGGIQHFS